MSVTVVVGGQYGSEGKGKLVSYLACSTPGEVATVRCGGSNAGHTAMGAGKKFLLRQLPSGVVADQSRLYLAAGMLLDLPVLFREIKETGVAPDRLGIDRNAMVISETDRSRESRMKLGHRVGSTLSGTGYATARKVLRDPSVKLAAAVPELAPFITDVSSELNDGLDRGATIIVEGTQGFGLSLHHSDTFPFVTSRDTTASAFLSEAGISPLQVTEVIVVLRTYPIRVGGHSGPLGGELSWEEVAARSGYPHPLGEYTTVTQRLRRVGEFDWNLAKRAVRANRPTALAVHGADYLDYSDYGETSWSQLSTVTRRFVRDLEENLSVPATFIFTGPGESDLIDRRGELFNRLPEAIAMGEHR